MLLWSCYLKEVSDVLFNMVLLKWLNLMRYVMLSVRYT